MCLPYLLYVINSSRIMLLRIFITLCIQFAISNYVNSQSLYRKNSQQHNDLNRDSNNLFLQSSFEDIEDLLKGAKVRFRECKSTELSVSDSYNQLLIMDSKGIFPIGRFLTDCSMNYFYLYCNVVWLVMQNICLKCSSAHRTCKSIFKVNVSCRFKTCCGATDLTC